MTDETFEPAEPLKPGEATDDVTDVINDESVEAGPEPSEDDASTSPQPPTEED